MGGHLWTSEEDELLRSVYPRAQWKKILSAFPHRTRESILQRAQYREVKRINGGRTSWTGSEKKRLVELYPRSSKGKLLEAFPRHNWGALSKMANVLGAKREVDVVAKYHRHPIIRRLRSARRERKMTLVDLAERIGTHHMQLTKYESGRQRPRLLTFFAWVEALNFELALRE